MKAGVADRQKRLSQQKQLLQQMRQKGEAPTPEQLKQVHALELKLEQLQRTLAQAVNGIGGQFDEKSDIWMIGVLAFELYFKAPPFGSQVRRLCELRLARTDRQQEGKEAKLHALRESVAHAVFDFRGRAHAERNHHGLDAQGHRRSQAQRSRQAEAAGDVSRLPVSDAPDKQ